jgi:hypothetical protein
LVVRMWVNPANPHLASEMWVTRLVGGHTLPVG